MHGLITQLGNENVVTLTITPSGDPVTIYRSFTGSQVFLVWRPAEQADNILVMFVNEGRDRAIFNYVHAPSNQGIPGSWRTDQWGSKIESRG